MTKRIQNREVKVCPVVLRKSGSNLELLVFEHPLADVQLIKGTLELTDSSVESAALRELEEESGISKVSSTKYLRSWESGFLAFCPMRSIGKLAKQLELLHTR